MGPFDRFNDRAKRVLALAQDEAVRFNHNYIGTEHLLLGLTREGEGIAARVLASLGVDLSALRRNVEASIGRGNWGDKPPSEITLHPQVKRVIDLGVDEARRLGHSHVGAEHLLLGIVREGADSPAARALASLGVDLEKVRDQVITMLRWPDGYASSPRPDPRELPSTGPFDLLDRTAKRVLALAEEEARLMRHNWIGTEHLLIALVRHGMSRTLHQLGVTPELARAGVFKAVPPKEAEVTDITITPRVRTLLGKAIMLAAPSAEQVGPRHLLLALVDDPGGIGAQVLIELGATSDKVWAAIAKDTMG